MKAQIFLVGLFTLLAVTACAGKPEITVQGARYDEPQLAQGQQLYAQYCASCHGANGEGQFPNSPNSQDEMGRIGAPPHNSTGHTSHHADDWLIRYVREGGISLSYPATFYPMPAFGDQLSEEQIALVIAYIKTLWETDGEQLPLSS